MTELPIHVTSEVAHLVNKRLTHLLNQVDQFRAEDARLSEEQTTNMAELNATLSQALALRTWLDANKIPEGPTV